VSFDLVAKRVCTWNKKASVRDLEPDTLEWWRSINLQAKLLVEEATEALEASELNDPVELLDGVLDSIIILTKFVDMLEKAGYRVFDAAEAIMQNNDLKIYSSMTRALEVKEELEEANRQGYYIDDTEVDGKIYFVVKRNDGKIAKAVDFPRVQLEEFLPR